MVRKKGLDRKAIALPFNWIFAVLVGGVILFLAVYAVGKFIGTSEKVSYTETGARLVAILESVGGSGSEKIPDIDFRENVKIVFSCDELSSRPFGKQTVSFGRDGEGSKISIKDKYVFAENIEGKRVSIFSKPFYLGYKVGDLLMISSKNYCFYKTPPLIKDEISGLGLTNVRFEDESFDGCPENSVNVCFAGENCDIEVIDSSGDFNIGKVVKNGEEMYFVGNLIFAAIFSSPEIYECNVKRLVGRFRELALMYEEKIKQIEEKGCDSNIDIKLDLIRSYYSKDSRDLIELIEMADGVDELNKIQPDGCKVW